jgi:hypothetical protein
MNGPGKATTGTRQDARISGRGASPVGSALRLDEEQQRRQPVLSRR